MDLDGWHERKRKRDKSRERERERERRDSKESCYQYVLMMMIMMMITMNERDRKSRLMWKLMKFFFSFVSLVLLFKSRFERCRLVKCLSLISSLLPHFDYVCDKLSVIETIKLDQKPKLMGNSKINGHTNWL